MSSLVKAELLAVCNSLGSFDGETYYKEPECLESLKDLIRFLKRDGNDHEIRRQLGETKVLKTDLIPILKTYPADNEVFNIIVRLLVNLTMPALVIYENAIPEDKMGRMHYMEVINYLQEYKEVFCDEAIWKILSEKLRDLLKLDWENRQEEDGLLIEWIFILVRNVLHVPSSPLEEMRTDDDVSIHDRILWGIHKSGMEDLLLFIANSEEYHEFCLHVLEIITLMLKEQTPEQLSSAGMHRSQTEKQRDNSELMDIREHEMQQKRSSISKYYGSRHTKFGGTFCMKDFKSISNNDLIVHRPVNAITAVNFDQNKTPRRRSKRQMPMEDVDCIRRSTLSIRLCLKEFCIEFLTNAYNTIMYIVKDQLARKHTQDHDETYYLWAIKFFMEFNRLHDFHVELVSETMSVSTFHYIQTQLENYQEMMISEKKKINLWSKRMQLALMAYRELIMTLSVMDGSADSGVRESAKVLKTNLFYTIEYRELSYVLLHHYDEVKMPKTYLKDLVEMNHVFLKLLEKHCKSYSHLIVGKKMKRKKTKKKKSSSAMILPKDISEEQLESIWSEISAEISSTIQGHQELPENIVPFDATSEVPIDEQKGIAMRRIQGYLRVKKGPEALALFRAARDVWPEGDCFGSSAMENEDEFLALREVMFASIPEGPIFPENSNSRFPDLLEDEEEIEENEEMDEVATSSTRAEQEFDFQAFVARFATSKVIQAYALLLRQYTKNSNFTNHCIIKMFHRLTWDCKMPSVLFQASLFRDFQKILRDPKMHTSDSLKEIAKFAKFIICKFFEVARQNNKVYVEFLFWKGRKEAFEIEQGYEVSKEQTKGGAKYVWTEEDEIELKQLYDEFKDHLEEGKDVVDLIMQNIADSRRTRRHIINQLKRQNLLLDVKTLKRTTSKKIKDKEPKEWLEEELDQLKSLFAEYRDADDIISRVMDNLTVKRPKKRVIQKLLDLGIVSSRKELRKKSKQKSIGNKNGQTQKRPIKTKPSSQSNAKAGKKLIKVSDDESDSGDSESEGDDDIDNASSDEERDDNTGNESQANAALIDALVCAVKCEELRGPVTWVRDDLTDIGKDRENEDDLEPVPLVPIMEENHVALGNPIFRKLLKLLGLKQPANEQETYWRYPPSLTARKCCERAQLINQALTGKLSSGCSEGTPTLVTSDLNEKNEPQPRQRARKIVIESDKSDSDGYDDVDMLANNIQNNAAPDSSLTDEQRPNAGSMRKEILERDNDYDSVGSPDHVSPHDHMTAKQNKPISLHPEESSSNSNFMNATATSEIDSDVFIAKRKANELTVDDNIESVQEDRQVQQLPKRAKRIFVIESDSD